MGFFDVKYLSGKHLQGFSTYKYNTVNTSYISYYITYPMWYWFLKFTPAWVAPNVLTLAGFICVLIGHLFVTYYDYYMDANTFYPSPTAIPNWVWLFMAITFFASYALDGMDGKQARRTGTSSPIGEFFDHGIDTWALVPVALTMFSSMGRGEFGTPFVNIMYVLLSVQIDYLIHHWEKYNTGVLYMSWDYDIGMWSIMGSYLLTYILGYESYKTYIFGLIKPAIILEFGFYIINICSVPFSLSKVYAAYFVRKSGLQPNAYEAFLPLFPSSVFFAVSIVWAHYSPNDIISVDPRCFFWTMGSVFSNIMCRLIVAQTTRTRAQTFNWLLAVYCIGAAIPLCTNVTVFTELLIIRTLALTTTLAHLHYGICVIRQLCDHFNTAAFSISRPQQSAQKTTHSSTAKTFDSNHSVHAEGLIKDMAFFPWD